MRLFSVGLMASVALGVTSLTCATARAQVQHTNWSTYFRAGPNDHEAVIDEVPAKSEVDVQGCDPHWCRVQYGAAWGYIDRDALDLPSLPPGTSRIGGPQGCFVADQYSFRTPAAVQFCQVTGKP